MKYNNVVKGKFVKRINRFEAYVEVEQTTELVHVKNTGRCIEILIPGTEVVLQKSDKKERKTKYDLIAAYKSDFGIINIDSQAPNKVAKEWLEKQNYDYIRQEYVFGESRIDFYMERDNEKFLMEVKGCTLEKNGIGYFPDAPTVRGVKHINELIRAKSEGYHAIMAFVIGMNSVSEVIPNGEIHPEFEEAYYRATNNGVEIVKIKCKITENEFLAI